MKKEHKIAQEIDAISELINSGDYQKALKCFHDLETNNPKINTLKFNKVGFLIDIGFGLKNSKIVKEGIVTGEKLLKDSSHKNQKTNLYYNCANGYTSLYHLEYDRERNAKQIVDNENLQNAKRNFREALKETNHFDSKFISQLWTNYGNCLDSLGRGVEALYAYDKALKIDPGFPMALGNKAIALRFFADISGTYREAVYIKSYQMLISVLKNEDLVKFGGIATKKGFEYETKQIEGRFKDKSLLSKNSEHPQYDLSRATSFEKFYIGFCSKHKLFLNFHIHDYVLMKNENGITTTKRIPKYQHSFKFKYGLPGAAYEFPKFLTRDEELLIKRYVQYRNTELFFSSIFILCEADTEKVLLERFFPYYKLKTPGQFGISVISCGGQVYSPFLKIANKNALDLEWYILSDAESETKQYLEKTIKKCGFDYDIFKNQIIYLPSGMDMESYYIDFYGTEIINDFISKKFGHRTIEFFKNDLEKELSDKNEEKAQSIDDLSEDQILNEFIDRKGKVKFAENFTSYVIENELEVPDLLKNLIDKAIEAVENG